MATPPVSPAPVISPISFAMIGLNVFQGFAAKKAAKKRARAIMQAAKSNVEIVRQNAEQQANAIGLQTEQLMREQRQLKAGQRLSVVGRGGALMGGSDLVAIANSAQKMQYDVLELGRQKSLARVYGENQAAKIMIEAEAAAYGAKIEGQSAMLNSIIKSASYVNFDSLGENAKKYFNPTEKLVNGPTRTTSSLFLESINPSRPNPDQVAGYGQPMNYNQFYNPTSKYEF